MAASPAAIRWKGLSSSSFVSPLLLLLSSPPPRPPPAPSLPRRWWQRPPPVRAIRGGFGPRVERCHGAGHGALSRCWSHRRGAGRDHWAAEIAAGRRGSGGVWMAAGELWRRRRRSATDLQAASPCQRALSIFRGFAHVKCFTLGDGIRIGQSCTHIGCRMDICAGIEKADTLSGLHC